MSSWEQEKRKGLEKEKRGKEVLAKDGMRRKMGKWQYRGNDRHGVFGLVETSFDALVRHIKSTIRENS